MSLSTLLFSDSWLFLSALSFSDSCMTASVHFDILLHVLLGYTFPSFLTISFIINNDVFIPTLCHRPCVAKWLQLPLGVRHTKDIKTGRFALLSLALGINELGNRLGGSESV